MLLYRHVVLGSDGILSQIKLASDKWDLADNSIIYFLCHDVHGGMTSCKTMVSQLPTQQRYTTCVKPWTHWGRVTHICASKIIIIGSDNGLARTRCQAIIWSNAGILLIRTLGTNFIEILSKVNTFWFKEMHLEMSSVKWRPFCFGLNVFTFFLFWFANQQIVPDTDASW